jgi:hypothetical protein
MEKEIRQIIAYQCGGNHGALSKATDQIISLLKKSEKQIANYWYMKGVKDAETTERQDVELSQTLRDFQTHFELQHDHTLYEYLPTGEDVKRWHALLVGKGLDAMYKDMGI